MSAAINATGTQNKAFGLIHSTNTKAINWKKVAFIGCSIIAMCGLVYLSIAPVQNPTYEPTCGNSEIQGIQNSICTNNEPAFRTLCENTKQHILKALLRK